jgi:anti-sigma B factor antagonist
MSVKMITREKRGVAIIDISGRLTLGEGCSALRTKMVGLAEGGSKKILLNMADVKYIDTSGLGELVAAHTTVTAAGGQIRLLNLAKRAHDLLEITKLYTIFETFEDETSALASFPAPFPSELQVRYVTFFGRIGSSGRR